MTGATADPRRVTVRDGRDRNATGERIVVVAPDVLLLAARVGGARLLDDGRPGGR